MNGTFADVKLPNLYCSNCVCEEERKLQLESIKCFNYLFLCLCGMKRKSDFRNCLLYKLTMELFWTAINRTNRMSIFKQWKTNLAINNHRQNISWWEPSIVMRNQRNLMSSNKFS